MVFFQTVAGRKATVWRAHSGHGKEVNSRLVWSFSLYYYYSDYSWGSGQRWVVYLLSFALLCTLKVSSGLALDPSKRFVGARCLCDRLHAAGTNLNAFSDSFISTSGTLRGKLLYRLPESLWHIWTIRQSTVWLSSKCGSFIWAKGTVNILQIPSWQKIIVLQSSSLVQSLKFINL